MDDFFTNNNDGVQNDNAGNRKENADGKTGETYSDNGYSAYSGYNGSQNTAGYYGQTYNTVYNIKPKKEKKPKDPMKKKFLTFGALTLAVCMFFSFLSGGVSSFLVMSYLNTDVLQNSQASAENLFVPDITQQSTTLENSTLAEENELTIGTTQAQTTTRTAENASKTKGEIYAESVNQVVCVTATYKERYSGWFGQSYSQQVTSSGSGFFITEDGYIITNYHVIENAEAVEISTYDGTTYEAQITGYEADNDVAVLKVQGNFSAVKLGDSSALNVGDDVMIIGNALGELSYTFTDGVVSYLSREISTDAGTNIEMFQTNAAINEGNSGGPVFNMNGEVVGIASAKYASSSIEGLGFCIPINDVRSLVNDIITYGYVTGKPEMGVSVQEISSAMSMRYSLPMGCYVVAVGDGSGADGAGIAENDVIVAIDGTDVETCEDIKSILADKKAGDTLSVKLYRSGSYLQVSLKLDEKKPADARTSYTNVYDF